MKPRDKCKFYSQIKANKMFQLARMRPGLSLHILETKFRLTLHAIADSKIHIMFNLNTHGTFACVTLLNRWSLVISANSQHTVALFNFNLSNADV